VPFKMRRKMLAPINTIKHYVHSTQLLITAGTISNDPIIVAVRAPATALSSEVREGAVIKAVYIERWLGGNTAGNFHQFTLTVEKKRTTESDMTFSQSQNLGGYPNKKNILYTTQGVLGSIDDGNQAVPVLRQYVLIPKGKQRFGLDDQLMVNIAFISTGTRCGIATYKEYV